MRKMVIGAILSLLLFCFSVFSVALSDHMPHGPFAVSDWDVLVEIRRAVTRGDEVYFSNNDFPDADGYYYIQSPRSVQDGKELLQSIDTSAALFCPECDWCKIYMDIEREPTDMSFEYSFHVETGEKLFFGAFSESKTSYDAELYTGEPAFILHAASGEDIPMYRSVDWPWRYYSNFFPEFGMVFYLEWPDDNPPIEMIGDFWIGTVSQLTPETGVPTISQLKDGRNPFPWLWIALPVGAAVIAGGAAFVLIRKKRKSSV